MNIVLMYLDNNFASTMLQVYFLTVLHFYFHAAKKSADDFIVCVGDVPPRDSEVSAS